MSLACHKSSILSAIIIIRNLLQADGHEYTTIAALGTKNNGVNAIYFSIQKRNEPATAYISIETAMNRDKIVNYPT